ncbi:hypothetical protein HK100_000477 [Physocladia obscura]|uniref:Uncharacterized protein n=1 Tax=Physocladia obscura TaxID=109957 RepID=A0AAD5T499_9FUNG|nr:hypothetical protein HK100_000477 [Physocladia obscura]
MVLSTKADRGQNGFQVIEAAPSPWVTKVEHFFILPFLPSKTNEDQQHEISAHMVPEDTAEYRASGIGYIMILRYANTPVGPYDEIMFIPGAFNSPLLSSKSNQNSTITPLASISWIQAHPLIHDARIAQIYVSSEASLRNGRVQFGIPKELADFEWSKTSSRFSTTHSIAVKDRISGILFAQFEIRTEIKKMK